MSIKYKIALGLTVLFSGIIGLIFLTFVLNEPITQKVEYVDSDSKIELAYKWDKEHWPYGRIVLYPSKPQPKNPFYTEKALFKLTTEYRGNKVNIDYGTEAKIKALKCKRYAEAVSILKTIERNELIEKSSKAKAEQLDEMECK